MLLTDQSCCSFVLLHLCAVSVKYENDAHIAGSRRYTSRKPSVRAPGSVAACSLKQIVVCRFIALSATIPNVEDVAEWLEAPPECESVRSFAYCCLLFTCRLLCLI